MASSQSFRKGQVPVFCSLCKMETKINLKCINCDTLICRTCKDKPEFYIHKYHEVIDLESVGQKPYEIIYFNSELKCQKHDNILCCLFCKDCDQLVCPICIAKIHNGHNLVEISDEYQLRVEKVKKIQTKTMTVVDKLTKGESKLSDKKRKELAIYEDAKQKIQNQNEALRKYVDYYTCKITEELDKKYKTVWKTVEEEDNKLIKLKEEFENLNFKAYSLLLSKDPAHFFSENYGIITKQSDTAVEPMKLKLNSVPMFQPGNICQENFGLLQPVFTQGKTKVLQEFNTDISRVLFLSVCDNDCLWMSDETMLQKVETAGTGMKVLSTIHIPIIDMALSPPGNIILAIKDQSKLKQICAITGELADSLFDLTPLLPTAVHVTENEELVVGAKSEGKPFPSTSGRVVIVLNKDGEQNAIYEEDIFNNRIFTYIRCLTTTKNGNIFVADIYSDSGSGRIKVLGKNADIPTIYAGHPYINTDKVPFKPVAMVTTPSDSVVVSQSVTYILHILDSAGHLMTHVDMEKVGIYRPSSLSYNVKGQLHVGCSTPKDSKEKARLYVVNTLGF